MTIVFTVVSSSSLPEEETDTWLGVIIPGGGTLDPNGLIKSEMNS
jgi:hypothetical protein